MCGIIGIFGDKEAGATVKQALALMKNRGRDAAGLSDGKVVLYADSPEGLPEVKGDVAFGHVLHSVVSKVPQPLTKEYHMNKKKTLFHRDFFLANSEVYNWESLAKEIGVDSRNDAELLFEFLYDKGLSQLKKVQGVFSFAWIKDNSIILSRDLLGVKPLWFVHKKDLFAFSSEKKVLEALGFIDIQELNPRHILTYGRKEKTVTIEQKEFFSSLPELKESKEQLTKKTAKLLDAAIEKRIPEKKFGVLFSGGIDSSCIAQYLKQHGHKPALYTAVLDTDGTEATSLPKDLVSAQEVAKHLGLELKVKKVKLGEIPHYLKKIVPLIEDSTVVKVGVALTFYLACELAREDGCKVVFSGLGSEEIFAGYERHSKAADVNKECVAGLLKMYERDLYRDDVITMEQNLELRLPFLDHELLNYALKIPVEYKMNNDHVKVLLREIAQARGLPESFAFKKKVAAQYGSKFDHALGKLAKREVKSKSEFLRQFYPSHNVKLGVLYSGGKDSTYAAHIMKRQNYDLTCLITMRSKNVDSYMFHTPAIELTMLQADAMELPLLMQETDGVKERELADLELAIKKAKEQYKIEGIVSGALFSSYQRDRIEKICDTLGLKIFAPLWHKPQDTEMQELVDSNYDFVFSAVAADGLNKSWLNKKIDEKALSELRKLHKTIGTNMAGEGGEFESLVLDCPLFKKKIELIKVKKVMENEYTGKLVVEEAKLVNK